MAIVEESERNFVRIPSWKEGFWLCCLRRTQTPLSLSCHRSLANVAPLLKLQRGEYETPEEEASLL